MPLFIVLFLIAVSRYSWGLPPCDERCIYFHENNPPVATVHNEELVCRYVNRDTGEVTLRATWENISTEGSGPASVLYVQCVYPRYADGRYYAGTHFCWFREDTIDSDGLPCDNSSFPADDFAIGVSGDTGGNKTFSSILWYAPPNPEKLEKILRHRLLCGFQVEQSVIGPEKYRSFKSNPVGFAIQDYKHLTAPRDFRYQWHDSQGYKFQWRLDRSPCDQVLCPDRKQYLLFHGFRFLFPSGIRWLITGNSLPVGRVALMHFCDTSPLIHSPVIFNPKRTEPEDMYPDFNQIPEVEWLAEVYARLYAGSLRFSCYLQYAGADTGAEGLRLPELQLQVVVIKEGLTESFVRAGLLTVEHRAGHLYLVSCQRRRHDQWGDVQKNCVVVSDDREVLKKSPDFCKFQGRTEL